MRPLPQPFWAFPAGELTKKWVSVPTRVSGLNVQEELCFCYRIGAKKVCLEPKRKTRVLLSCCVVSVNGKLWQSNNTSSKYTDFMGDGVCGCFPIKRMASSHDANGI